MMILRNRFNYHKFDYLVNGTAVEVKLDSSIKYAALNEGRLVLSAYLPMLYGRERGELKTRPILEGY